MVRLSSKALKSSGRMSRRAMRPGSLRAIEAGMRSSWRRRQCVEKETRLAKLVNDNSIAVLRRAHNGIFVVNESKRLRWPRASSWLGIDDNRETSRGKGVFAFAEDLYFAEAKAVERA